MTTSTSLSGTWRPLPTLASRRHRAYYGEGAALRRAHAADFLAVAEQAEPQLNDTGRETWLERLEVEHNNLRGALAWSMAEPGAAETEARLAWFWYLRGGW